MSDSFNLDPVTRITAGALGEPGQRVFFIQARAGDLLVTLQAEKQQVQVLATTLVQLLESLPEGEEIEDDMELEDPLLPAWRIGPMAIEVDELRDMILLIAEEAVPDDDEVDEAVTIPARARFAASPAQMKALAEHAELICAAGRPRCQLCGFPIEVDGHACPAQNGHRHTET